MTLLHTVHRRAILCVAIAAEGSAACTTVGRLHARVRRTITSVEPAPRSPALSALTTGPTCGGPARTLRH